ncbi:hypothetical protein B0H13DRAFT_1515593, partial [Mycena leptocephala]
ILTKFDLLFDEVRLMQTASSAIISGSTVAALAGSPTPFNPNDLDIYAGRGEGWHVVKYLENGNKYRAVKEETSYDFASGIGKVWTLRHRRTDKKINVIESLSSNPLHSVLHFHFTPVFGAWSANEFWHGYADLTASGYAMTTLTHLPLKDDLQNHKHVWKVLQKYKRRGFSFALDECLAPHVCGEHKDCPATLRTSDDAGCLTMAFPVW